MKNILITGANRGVGLELVCQLMERNDVKMVFATARVPDKAKVSVDFCSCVFITSETLFFKHIFANK
jgi:NAD(P)-dependent dehydrogenase (short-subunit alcohol dehydrogenase family)